MKSLTQLTNKYLLFVIILFSLSLRIVGLNWDQNQHLHPDERFLTMAVDALKWPKNISSYFYSSTSTLNPNNQGYEFYVYGTFPTTLNKWFSQKLILNSYSYHNNALTGRLLSVFFDIGVLILVFKIAKLIFDEKKALLSTFFYGIMVLPIQLSHFFTVDPPLTFFLTFSFYFLLQMINSKSLFYPLLVGISLGAAFACKISAVLFLPILLIGFIVHFIKHKRLMFIVYCLLFTTVCIYLSYRILDPHAFSDSILVPSFNKIFLQNLEALKFWSRKDSIYPPAIQWLKINPVIFPIRNIILWGVGLPQSLILVIGYLFVFFEIIKQLFLNIKNVKNIKHAFTNLQKIDNKVYFMALLVLWIVTVYFYETTQLAPSMRYFYPVYPMFAIIIGYFLTNRILPLFKNPYIPYAIFYIPILVWPLSFIQIYKRPHSRVTASKWIYQNIPAGSTLSCEHWDDCLPLTLGEKYYQQKYKIEILEFYNPDTPEKWKKINLQLQNIDYIIMSSNRLWGSIPKVPEIYPQTAEFYNDLFTGKLGFEKVTEITSYPTIPILNSPIRDDSSEEAFTVYDHPKILIYKRNN